jgi:hypothetical protein
VLILLFVLLLLVGGGFGPPLLGIILGIAATRIGAASRRPPGRIARVLARASVWIFVAGVIGSCACCRALSCSTNSGMWTTPA